MRCKYSTGLTLQKQVGIVDRGAGLKEDESEYDHGSGVICKENS